VPWRRSKKRNVMRKRLKRARSSSNCSPSPRFLAVFVVFCFADMLVSEKARERALLEEARAKAERTFVKCKVRISVLLGGGGGFEKKF
jgi:hypothetical protein